MRKQMQKILATLLLTTAANSGASEYNYASISERYPDTALSSTVVADSIMQGECLVGLKELNFKKKDHFDPIAEWTSFRSGPLLEQFPPCQVLIMLEVAQQRLRVSETD